MPTDARGELQDGRFEYQSRKDGRVVLTWFGQAVTTLAGKDAERFLARMAGLHDYGAQLLVAHATSNFRRGNERAARRP